MTCLTAAGFFPEQKSLWSRTGNVFRRQVTKDPCESCRCRCEMEWNCIACPVRPTCQNKRDLLATDRTADLDYCPFRSTFSQITDIQRLTNLFLGNAWVVFCCTAGISWFQPAIRDPTAGLWRWCQNLYTDKLDSKILGREKFASWTRTKMDITMNTDHKVK
jgi:hypothetical protein